MIVEIKIKTLMTESDYVKFNFYNLYFKPLGITITIIGAVLAFLTIKHFVSGDYLQYETPILQILFAIYILIGIPMITYFMAKRKYSKSKLTKDVIQYTFNDKGVEISGSNYDSKIEWVVVHKIEETKNWFLIYLSQRNAHLIHKSDFKKSEIPWFKSLIRSRNIKSRLKTST